MDTSIRHKKEHHKSFDSMVVVAGECHEWSGSRIWNGYGRFRVCGTEVLAHRYSWERHNGPIPAGMCVLHTCDNRTCVNHKHLWLGTRTDNMKDMVAKGRHLDGRRTAGNKVAGSNNGISKLTESAAIEIYRSTGSQRHIARAFGVSWALVHQIKLRKIWRRATESISNAESSPPKEQAT